MLQLHLFTNKQHKLVLLLVVHAERMNTDELLRESFISLTHSSYCSLSNVIAVSNKGIL